MKGLFIGLVLGAIATWAWFHTGGKISITETKTITIVETNRVTKTETRYFDETRWTIKTNEVWKTNIIEQVVRVAPVVMPPDPIVQKVEQPKNDQPIVQGAAAAPVTKASIELKGARTVGRVKTSGTGKVKMGVKRNMDGSVKEQ